MPTNKTHKCSSRFIRESTSGKDFALHAHLQLLKLRWIITENSNLLANEYPKLGGTRLFPHDVDSISLLQCLQSESSSFEEVVSCNQQKIRFKGLLVWPENAFSYRAQARTCTSHLTPIMPSCIRAHLAPGACPAGN